MHERLDAVGTGVRTNGLVGKMLWVQCRADSVEHTASPSHRDASRRVVVSPVIPTSVRRCRTLKMFCTATPRTSVRSTCLQVPPSSSLPGSCSSFPGSERSLRSGEIWTQNSRSHIAMSYELSTAWKASLRAHRRRFARPLMVLKPRWSQEPLNAASDLITTRWCSYDNRGFQRGSRLFASVATLHARVSKPSF